MKVFKFGGASLKDAAGIKNVASIIQLYADKNLLIVVSAMGKTTNALEKIVNLSGSASNHDLEITLLKKYHEDVMHELFPDEHPAFTQVSTIFHSLEQELEKKGAPDQIYDQVVSLGEVVSSIIVHHYLLQNGLDATWLDARKIICTDRNFREGRVDWQATAGMVDSLNKNKLYITQGFIGSTPDGLTTTLGREGSDFSAAIFAYCMNAESVTIWKDVPGVMSADPKRLPNAIVFDELPFREAAEMTYYGASVIHPKTIKPLANKGIPLLVKNFDNPKLPGTKIHECHVDSLPPLIVFKENQCLISCKVTDYTFVNEQQLGIIFNILNELDVRINVMQNSAISFSFCVDFRERKVAALIEKLQKHFEVYYNTGLTLITVKNYDQQAFETYRNRPGLLMEQSSRSTLQVLVRN